MLLQIKSNTLVSNSLRSLGHVSVESSWWLTCKHWQIPTPSAAPGALDSLAVWPSAYPMMESFSSTAFLASHSMYGAIDVSGSRLPPHLQDLLQLCMAPHYRDKRCWWVPAAVTAVIVLLLVMLFLSLLFCCHCCFHWRCCCGCDCRCVQEAAFYIKTLENQNAVRVGGLKKVDPLFLFWASTSWFLDFIGCSFVPFKCFWLHRNVCFIFPLAFDVHCRWGFCFFVLFPFAGVLIQNPRLAARLEKSLQQLQCGWNFTTRHAHPKDVPQKTNTVANTHFWEKTVCAENAVMYLLNDFHMISLCDFMMISLWLHLWIHCDWCMISLWFNYGPCVRLCSPFMMFC